MRDTEENIMLIYKIRRTTDGLFSTGTMKPKFNRNGKVWSTWGHVIQHLKYDYNSLREVYKNCEIVEYNCDEYGKIDILEIKNV